MNMEIRQHFSCGHKHERVFAASKNGARAKKLCGNLIRIRKILSNSWFILWIQEWVSKLLEVKINIQHLSDWKRRKKSSFFRENFCFVEDFSFFNFLLKSLCFYTLHSFWYASSTIVFHNQALSFSWLRKGMRKREWKIDEQRKLKRRIWKKKKKKVGRKKCEIFRRLVREFISRVL